MKKHIKSAQVSYQPSDYGYFWTVIITLGTRGGKIWEKSVSSVTWRRCVYITNSATIFLANTIIWEGRNGCFWTKEILVQETCILLLYAPLHHCLQWVVLVLSWSTYLFKQWINLSFSVQTALWVSEHLKWDSAVVVDEMLPIHLEKC